MGQFLALVFTSVFVVDATNPSITNSSAVFFSALCFAKPHFIPAWNKDKLCGATLM